MCHLFANKAHDLFNGDYSFLKRIPAEINSLSNDAIKLVVRNEIRRLLAISGDSYLKKEDQRIHLEYKHGLVVRLV